MEKSKMFRHEYKYLLDYSKYLQLANILSKTMQQDKNWNNSEGYLIRSLYFDDIYDTALKEKALGIAYRKKYRVRIYNYSDKMIKLEEKIKMNDYIKKNSSPVNKAMLVDILSDTPRIVEKHGDSLQQRFYLQKRINFFKPKVIVDYQREAYILPFNQIRITIDKDLAAAKPVLDIFNKDLTTYQLSEQYRYILEVKYNNFLPNHLKKILAYFCVHRMAVSKYFLCRQYIDKL
ncbi:MAG: polyphosphate polymerase domain-containing protein [Bacillota bacterium]